MRALLALYGMEGEQAEAVIAVARQARQRGWWHSYGDAIPEWFELYVGLEAAAARLRTYEAQLIPGLLQTEAYATRAYEVARSEMTREEIERGVAVRLSRQALLTRTTPRAPQVNIVLDEAVLRRGVDAEQLQRLVAVSRQPNVSLRGATRHWFAPGQHEQRHVHDSRLRRGAEPSIIYSDSLTSALYLDRPGDVATYSEVWASMEKPALTEAQSRKLIASIAEEQA